jgi:VWFA-related protein
MRQSSRNIADGHHQMLDSTRVRVCCALAFFVLSAAAIAPAQSVTPPPQNPDGVASQSSPANVPEVATHENLETFQVRVNLVEVRVVVRDAQGNAVGNLKQEDFLLFDDKKPQTITKFTIERNTGFTAAASAKQAVPVEAGGNDSLSLASKHRTAYVFDDVGATPSDLILARNAVTGRIAKMPPDEYAGIFTISGQGDQDFTNDHDKLQAALLNLKARPVNGFTALECPPIDYYTATQIARNYDAQALTMVMQEVVACLYDGNGGAPAGQVEVAARNAAERVMQAGENQTNLLLKSVNDIVRRMSVLPGERNIVFLSPGFFIGDQQAALNDYIDRAIRAGVVINTLDIKGLYTQSANGVDISQKAWGSAAYTQEMQRYNASSLLAQGDTLLQIANSTGGTYFHNSNDLAAGVDKLSGVPEYSYLLGFTPQNLKNEGGFHALKVEVKQGAGLTVQARKGYNAPAAGGDSKREAQREIADEVFSQNELHELPLRVQTQFFRGADNAHIAVVVHVDVRHMAFRKSAGRNLNELTVVAALFDRNANFISAKSNTVQMHIKDETLTKLNSGIVVKSNFDVNPGSYIVRVVARDEQGKLVAQNDVVEIP